VKQKLDAVRTLAIQLYKAGQREKSKYVPDGTPVDWRNLESETVAIWDAVAIEAYKQLRK